MDFFLNEFVSEDEVEEAALQTEMSVAVSLDQLLKVAGDYDTSRETPTLKSLFDRIKQRFEKERISPEATSRVDILRPNRSESWSLINSVEKGYIFSRLRELLSASIKRQTLEGFSIPEYFYLFKYYFKYEIHRIGNTWEIVFDDAFGKPQIKQDETEKVLPNERDRAVRLLQHYGEQLSIRTEGSKTNLTVLGETLEVQRNRIEEDKKVWSAIRAKQASGLLPFYEEELQEGLKLYTLRKTYPFVTQHYTKDSCTVAEDDKSVTIEVLSEKDVIKVGDGSAWISIKAKPPHIGKSTLELTGPASQLRLCYSTDLGALVQKQGPRSLTVVQHAHATIENVVLLMPSRRDLLPYSCSISTHLQELIGKGRKSTTVNWSMYRFVKSFFQRPRTLSQLELVLSMVEHPHIRSLGKYCAFIGLSRLQIEKTVLWASSSQSEELFIYHLYCVENGTRGENLLSNKYGENALNIYKEVEGVAKEGLFPLDPTFFKWARGSPLWPDDRQLDREQDSEKILSLVGLDPVTGFEVFSKATLMFPQDRFCLASVNTVLGGLVESGHLLLDAQGWRNSYVKKKT